MRTLMNRIVLAITLVAMPAVALAGTPAARGKAAPTAEQKADRQAHRAERQAKRAERVAKFDANRDGKLSDTERAAMHKQRRDARFAKLDANSDGSISRAEFDAAAGKMKGRHGGKGHMGRRGGADVKAR